MAGFLTYIAAFGTVQLGGLGGHSTLCSRAIILAATLVETRLIEEFNLASALVFAAGPVGATGWRLNRHENCAGTSCFAVAKDLMRFIRHPVFERDLAGIVDHSVDITDGDLAAAGRRLDEIDDLLQNIVDSPASGVRLSGRLDGWLVRHGGSGHRLTIVFKPDVTTSAIYLSLVAFGGRDWMKLADVQKALSE